MNQDSLKLIALYGDKDMFQAALNDGFEQIAFADGPRLEDGTAIVGAFILGHCDGRIRVIATPKSYTDSGTALEERQVMEMEGRELDDYQVQHRLVIDKFQPLAELVAQLCP